MAFQYDAIIIGTGFGATVAATELVFGKGKKNILMLERGVWWYTPERPLPDYIKANPQEPVQYWPRPDHFQGVMDLLSVVKTNNEFVEGLRDIVDRPQPLYRYNSFDEIDILTASGVGGGSLIYSNVSIRAFFDKNTGKYPITQDWPVPVTSAMYDKAEQWMKTYRGAPAQVVTKFPLPVNNYPNLPQVLQDNPLLYLGRSRWLKEASESVTTDLERVEDWGPLNLQINDYDGKKPADLTKFAPCERQGRCFLGCLPGARHTLNKTLVNKDPNLLNGPNAPVKMRALAEVDHIEKLTGGGYEVFFDDLHFGDDDAGRKQSATAPVVIVAAGVLGTAQILLQSRDHLQFSEKLGRQFSTNGDAAGFVTYDTAFPYGIYSTRGPINTSHVMYRKGDLFINVEDAGVPPMLASSVKKAIEVFTKAADRDPFFQDLQAIWRLAVPGRELKLNLKDPLSFETEHEALQNTFFFNLMGRDQARGKFEMDGKHLKLGFEGGPLAQDAVYKKIDELMKAMSEAMGGQYVRFPFWGQGNHLLDNEFHAERKAITVHPLGGCPMGHSSSDGAVDTRGRVFNTKSGGDSVHEGLYVTDAAVIPGPLAVNPTLTIVAFAKAIAEQIPAALATAGGN